MWERGWRDRVWADLDQTFDLVVIGGGITGAGVLREAVRLGLRALLLEAADFASGTSSRSSKLVHGGLRYLRQGRFRLTLESVRERERLLREGRGLVHPLPFLLPVYHGDRPSLRALGLGLRIYDWMAGRRTHQRLEPEALLARCPPLNAVGLLGGYLYEDAEADDARLVLRVLREAVRAGGLALNYARVVGLLRDGEGQVCGVQVRDEAPGAAREAEVRAAVVVNAAGPWADEVRGHVGGPPRLRRLRGGHLVFPRERLPVDTAVTLLHPRDGRPVFTVPWEGAVAFGTTDVDHQGPLTTDPAISPEEVAYLMEALQRGFPGLYLTPGDALAAYAGVRPVVNTGKPNPSQESREHVLWQEAGLLTITGGKLTTFHRMAQQALRAAAARLGRRLAIDDRSPALDPAGPLPTGDLRPEARARLMGRYGGEARQVLEAARPGELEPVEGTPTLWAEVRWAARAEGVVHLEDLMLRRTRLGLLLPRGGEAVLERVGEMLRQERGWGAERWRAEVARYRDLWRRAYAPPG